MKPLDQYRTLLLDNSYRPVKIISWTRALTLDYQDKVTIVETYDRVVRSPSHEFVLPAVIALKQYLRYRPLKVRYSKRNIFLRDGYCCQYCGDMFPKHELTIDHVLPKSRGGRSTWENVTTACERCNHAKGDRMPKEAGMVLLTQPERPDASTPALIGAQGPVPDEWKHYLVKAG
jgi:5-methylcytosine-specific restriction endonuclease McrA